LYALQVYKFILLQWTKHDMHREIVKRRPKRIFTKKLSRKIRKKSQKIHSQKNFLPQIIFTSVQYNSKLYNFDVCSNKVRRRQRSASQRRRMNVVPFQLFKRFQARSPVRSSEKNHRDGIEQRVHTTQYHQGVTGSGCH
jgi:hypothetical protein